MLERITYLDDAARQVINLPIPTNNAGPLVDVEKQNRDIAYMKVNELMSAWEYLYQNYIVGEIWSSAVTDESISRLDEVIRELDSAMIGLTIVLNDQQRVIARLEDIQDALSRKKKGKIIKRSDMRGKAVAVTTAFKRMRDKAACPQWAKRQWQKLWGGIRLNIPEAEVQRYRMIAASGLAILSQNVAIKVNMDNDVASAFKTLNLNVWATKADMEERYRYMIRRYHPDHNREGEDMSKEINGAKDRLEKYYYGLGNF